MDGQLTTGFASPSETYADNRPDWNSIILPKPHAMYLFRVTGNDLEGFGILDKDMVIIDCSEKPITGKIVAAILEEEFHMGRLEPGPLLVSAGNVFPIKEDSRIIGVVSRLVRCYDEGSPG